jgi:hypothetical protein
MTLTTHFKNTFAYIPPLAVSDGNMFQAILQVKGTEMKHWKLTRVSVDESYKRALEENKNSGKIAFGKALYSRSFVPGL